MLAVNKVYSFLYRIALLGFPKQRVANKEINFDKSHLHLPLLTNFLSMQLARMLRGNKILLTPFGARSSCPVCAGPRVHSEDPYVATFSLPAISTHLEPCKALQPNPLLSTCIYVYTCNCRTSRMKTSPHSSVG